ncbi:MAG: 4Fe-4S binding protein [Gammaproteobacteria bacterium]|nr:4Fe-4S binding protein [Gammaproteobacteria bacterium]MDH3578000.1 4Fe-4S binding protein [Gammaproteobacteria bacterium]
MALRDIAIRWYRKAFAAPAGSDIKDEGLETVLDGNSAVALSEAGIAGHAVLGGSFPSGAADTVWLAELEHGNTNLFGEALSAQTAEGPRGIIAAATGLALSGRRATAFLSGPDLAAAQDLLVSAAGKHAPLVLHLGTRAAAGHGAALGSGHDTVHLGAHSGFFMLFATNVQEAIDFTYIARRVAEESLVPGMVIMDGEQTALAAQDVRLLSPAQIDGFLGPARQQIESPTAAQKILFGETRRRVPAWHDLDEPVLSGALFETESFALGAAARGPYFDAFVGESLAKSFEQFAGRTGRRYESISRYRLDDAKTVLLAQGAAVETARVAADCLRKQHNIPVGVLGIHALRPFPDTAIVEALRGREQVFVLERTDTPMFGEQPLLREVRASLQSKQPGCRSVAYGVGGLPLRVADLVELCINAETSFAGPLFLGLAFDDISGAQPKREVLMDTLRRAYPDAAKMGVHAGLDTTSPQQNDTLTIAIHQGSARGGEGLLGTTGALLHRLKGGRIRTRPAISWQHGSSNRADWLTHGDETLQDPGDGLTADITLFTSSGQLLLGEEPKVFQVPLQSESATSGTFDAEALLGGLFGVLIDTGLLESRTRRVIAERRDMLDGVDEVHREKLMDAFQSGLEQVAVVDSGQAASAAALKRWDEEAPAAVRHLGRNDDHYASLPRFWDQLGVLYRDGQSDRLTADPYLATGTMPPLSSTFNNLSDTRRMLPVFDPALCTGCGLCWTHCPDSAIGVVAASPAALIDAAITHTGAEAVRQVSGKLASRIIADCKARDKAAGSAAPTFGEMLDESFSWLEEKMPLTDDRKQAIREGLGAIGAEIAALPVAVTEPFFHQPEAQKKDSAELLSLVINPDACKACSICIDSCEPEALRAHEQDAAALDNARELWPIWANTADTSAETIERIASNAEIGTMAAILLSRYCQFALAGGDAAEAGSGEKMAVRLTLAATEFHQQPLVQRFARTLSETGESVTSLLTDTLSGTLAVEDLDAVTEQLKRTTSPRVDLKTLAEGAGKTSADHSIDTRYLLRLIELSKQITSAHHRLVQGKHGLGRARYGLVVAGGSAAEWAGAFPNNPFQAPVLIDMSGDAAQLSAGLIEGHLEETTELVRLLRLARLETDKPDGLEWKRDALAKLSWKDLSKEEYELCPPLLLVGSDEMLAGRGLGQLIWLLNSGLPVKVLVLHTLDFGLASDPAARTAQAPTNNPRASLAFLALAQRNAFIAQTSVADPVHLGDSMLKALGFGGPALIQVYAPSPTRHGFASAHTLAQAELAVSSRAMPLFRYDPTIDGVFGSRISLQGNPHIDETMVPDANGERPLTAADWAIGQQRFSTNFEVLSAEAAAPVALHEWLQLDARSRDRKTPYVAVGTGDEERRYSMAPAMLDMVEQSLQGWQTLQELAGIVTPFTERLEQDIRAEVAAEHRAELDAQSEASEARIREIQEKIEVEIASKIRSRLMQLASRKRGG